MQQYT